MLLMHKAYVQDIELQCSKSLVDNKAPLHYIYFVLYDFLFLFIGFFVLDSDLESSLLQS